MAVTAPFQIKPEDELEKIRAEVASKGGDPRRVRPDGGVEADALVDAEAMKQFLIESGALDGAQAQVMAAKTIRVIDGETGQERTVDEADDRRGLDPMLLDGPEQQKVFAKVARFLDPKLQAPIMLFEVRNKIFVMTIPPAQAMIDVDAFTGRKLSENEATLAQAGLRATGECLKGCLGWLPAKSPNVALVKAHIDDPTKWLPLLRPVDWLAVRDDSFLVREAFPLFDKYRDWREKVEPTPEEIDFYYARLD